MRILEMRMRWLFIVLVFLFSGCLAEPKPITPTPLIAGSPSAALPALNSPVPVETISTTATLPATPAAVAENCTRGDYFEEIESGRQTRQFLLHIPATYDPLEPGALVLVFHGAGISAERFAGYSRFSAVADREGFLVVYPQGQGAPDEPFWDTSPGSRDVQFIRDLIDQLLIRCNVDPNQVYASGHSNGGGMVHRLACELADRIAAIGPISGAYASSGKCTPSRPIPVFAIHGTADPVIPYDRIPAWAAAWAERNGCDPEPVDVPHNVVIREQLWTNCRQGADVVLYTVHDLGHDWTHDIINMGQTIWEFFEQHPMSS
jgi:polyhydroxybutyrate depolymerase